MLVASLFIFGLAIGWLVAGCRRAVKPGGREPGFYRGCESVGAGLVPAQKKGNHKGLPLQKKSITVGDPKALAVWDKQTDEKQLKRKRRHG